MKDLKDYLTNVVVLNAHDTTSDPHEYGFDSWRDYWEAHGHSRNELEHHRKDVTLKNGKHEFVEVYRCLMCGKFYQWDGELPDCFDGCHVYIKGERYKGLYIFPFCHACNHSGEEAEVPFDMLVVAPKKK